MLKFRTTNVIFAIMLVALLVYDLVEDVPAWPYVIFILIYLIIQVYGTAVLSAQYFMPVIFKGEKKSNSVALTFDDGPIPGNTEKVLQILEAHKVKAAFFCIGNRVTEHPNLVTRIFEEGHLIGNHSYWHKATFDLQTAGKIKKELLDTDQSIRKVIGAKPNFFRPPYGVTNPMVAKAVRESGHKTIGWSVRSFDTVTKDSTVLMNRITKSLKGGDVILLHDYSNTTLEILPALLDHIANVGLKIVRVDQLLNERPYA